jgi:hypothetical protein
MRNQLFHLSTQKIESKIIKFPTVNYCSHPAFKFDQSKVQASREIEKILCDMGEEINPLFGYSNVECDYTKDQIEKILNKIDGKADKIINVMQSHIDINGYPQIFSAVIDALVATKKVVRKEAYFRFGKIKSLKADISVLQSIEMLEDYGFCVYKLDSDLLKRLNELVSGDLKLLKENSIKNPNNRQNIGYVKGNLFDSLKNMISPSIADEAVKLFCGDKMEVESIMLEYSHPNSTWFRDCYSDLSIPTAPTAYFHTDREFDRLKMVINLSDVGSNQGPFSFVPSSNKMPRNVFQFAYFKELDLALNTFFKEKASEGPSYYRKAFGDVKLRVALNQIPPILLGHSHFGDDMIEGEDSSYLLRHEFHLTSNVADAALFDGHNGIHRGGLVKAGERVVLYIGWGVKKTLIRRLSAKLGGYFS